MFKTLIDIIASPQEAFKTLHEKPSFIFPIILLIISTAGLQFFYFSTVDPQFFIDFLVEQQGGDPATRDAMSNVNPMTIGYAAIGAVIIMVPIVMCLYAGYLSFISKFNSTEIKFKQWLSLTAWTSIVTVFSAIAGYVVVLSSSDGMIAQTDLSVFSLNNLIFQTTGPYQGILSSIDLTQLWSLGLTAMAYKAWTKGSLTGAILVACAPYLVIYGISAVVASL